MNPVCGTCEREMPRELRGMIVIYMNTIGCQYKAYYADLHRCPQCKETVVMGFADNPFWRDSPDAEPIDENKPNVIRVFSEVKS